MCKIFLPGPRDGEFYAHFTRKYAKMYIKKLFFCPKTTLNGYIIRNMHGSSNIKPYLDSPIQGLSKRVLEEVSRIICWCVTDV